MKIPETTSNGKMQCEEQDGKFQVEGWATLSLSTKSHIKSSNPDVKSKANGFEIIFHYSSFLTSVYGDAI